MFSFLKQSLVTGYEKLKESLGFKTETLNIELIERTLLEQNFIPQLVKKILDRIENNTKKEKNWQTICHEVLVQLFETTQAKIENPDVIILIGINGSGKTTTALKLARTEKKNGFKTVLIPADTFRAAAQEQLEELAKEFGVDFFSHQYPNPSTVIFKGAEFAKGGNYEKIIIDTAGRIHQSDALLRELEKFITIAEKQFSNKKIAHYLVLDGLQGKALIEQTKQFIEFVRIDGIIVTKLDGNVKPGVLCSIVEAYKIPIVYLSAGQKNTDLVAFSYLDFINLLVPKN